MSKATQTAIRGAIGVDVGGTKTLCVLYNERFERIKEIRFGTAPSEGRAKFTKRLTSSMKSLVAQANRCKLGLVGVGVAFAGQIDHERCVVTNSPNILCLEGLALGGVLKRATHLNVVAGNDVQLALYGEHQLGVAKDCDYVLGIFFGTGVGGAAIIDGKLYSGAHGLGGQIGSTLTHSIGGAETLESHGILDRIASKSAIAGSAIGLGVKQWAPNLYNEVGTDISLVTWGALSRARKAGDKQINDLIRGRLRVVGIALSSIINFLNPQLLVLGGGLTEEMPRLVVSSVEGGLREYLVPEISRKLKIKPARFGNEAGALGAAKLAFDRLT